MASATLRGGQCWACPSAAWLYREPGSAQYVAMSETKTRRDSLAGIVSDRGLWLGITDVRGVAEIQTTQTRDLVTEESLCDSFR